MEKKNKLISFSSGLVVLVAILIQSGHSFHHLFEKFSEEKCFHDYSQNKTQLTHSHDIEHCFACEFIFFNTIVPSCFYPEFLSIENYSQKIILFSIESPSYYNGIHFSLRGPPLV